jgi:hypothetical protein
VAAERLSQSRAAAIASRADDIEIFYSLQSVRA